MKRSDLSVTFDPEIGAFRVDYGRPVRTLTKEERPAVARETVSTLLAQAFGKPLRNGNTGMTIPSHLRKYVKKP